MTKVPAVGKPPISRWEYPGFVVYFEHDHVIHSVVSGAAGAESPAVESPGVAAPAPASGPAEAAPTPAAPVEDAPAARRRAGRVAVRLPRSKIA